MSFFRYLIPRKITTLKQILKKGKIKKIKDLHRGSEEIKFINKF